MAETSDIQRRAYNAAFREVGLNWHWDEDTYRRLLASAGGRARLQRLSMADGPKLSEAEITAIHTRKTEIACAEILSEGVGLRRGVQRVMELTREKGFALGFITSTYRVNIDAVLQSTGLSSDVFDLILDREDAPLPKPHPDIYLTALDRLSISPKHAIAIEDTAASEASARQAGLQTIVTPGEFTAQQSTPKATLRVSDLSAAIPFLTDWAGQTLTKDALAI